MPTKMTEQATTPTAKRKNASLGFFSNIFKRKRDETDPAHVVHTAGDVPLSPPPDREGAGQQMMTNIEQDLQKLQMSRQDNPFLQQLQSSGEDLVAAEDEADDSRLVVTESGNNRQLALAEIHSHLVRSPPPIPWPRSSQKFDFQELHESARIVEVIPRSNLRPLAAKDREEVMDQCLQDILQTQRSMPLQKASAVDETFTGRLSPRTSPLKAPATVRQLSPRRGRTPPDRSLLEPAVPGEAAVAAAAAPPETRLDTPLAPVRAPRRSGSQDAKPKLSLQVSATSFQRSPEKPTVKRPNT